MLTGGAWRKRATVQRWAIAVAAGAVVVAAGASVAVALGGNRAPAPPPHSSSSPPAASPVAMPKQCATWHCTRAQTADLGGGYAVSVWHAGKAGDFTTKPVLELSRDGVAVQWWLSPNGFGWSGALTCAGPGAPEPHCVFTDGSGAHSSIAQVLLLRSGRLTALREGYVEADLPTVLARDLDGDGYLDVVALDSDYTPNFAQGHLFWNTFQYAGRHLVSTGCQPRTSPHDAPPTRLADGPCPQR